MVAPVRFPHPTPREWPLTPFEALPPPGAAERLAARMRDLPALDSRAALLALTDRDLPSTDGLAPPDLMFQDEAISYTLLVLRAALRRRHPEVYVSGYTLVYDTGGTDESGRSSPVWVVPDVLVAFGVGSRNRQSYVLWQEGKPPDFVLEVASVSTWRRDRDEKRSLYESLGVREYLLYDPMGGLLEPRLQGHVLRGGAYRAMELERLVNGERGLRSEVLGLWAYLRGPGRALRWHDPASGKDLEDHEEVLAARHAAETARRAAETRAREEKAARRAAQARALAAEEEAAELRAQLRRLRGGSGT